MFTRQRDGIDVGMIGYERALRILVPELNVALQPTVPSLIYQITFMESDRGMYLMPRAEPRPDSAPAVAGEPYALLLDCEQTNALGRFCVRQFTMEEPTENIAAIRKKVEYTIAELDAWNDRARADEEHPPYDKITDRLRSIEHHLQDLEKGLKPP